MRAECSLQEEEDDVTVQGKGRPRSSIYGGVGVAVSGFYAPTISTNTVKTAARQLPDLMCAIKAHE